jgi:hypothetical protein
MGNDESRKLVLARRARFVAAALAGVAASTTPLVAAVAVTEGCGGETSEPQPQPSLSVDASPGDGDARNDTGPQPCLSVDADVNEPTEAGNGDAAGPKPCLAPPSDP